MSDVIRFTVVGQPATAGSKRGFPVRAKGGKIVGVRVTDDSKRSKPWQAVIADAGAEAMQGRPLLRHALVVSFTFYRARPKGHMSKRGGLVPSAPRFLITRPDALKYARCAEDALTGVVWADDAIIVDEYLRKRYGEPERLEVEVRRATAADLVESETVQHAAGLQLRAL